MDYLLVMLAVLCIAAQFTLNKLYQKNFVKGLRTVLFGQIITAVSIGVFFVLLRFATDGVQIGFGAFTVCMALALSAVAVLSAILGILVIKRGKISVYTIFMMLGGMLLPFIYGVAFLNERLTPARIIGMIILVIALFLPFIKAGDVMNGATDGGGAKHKTDKTFIALCACVFALNGCTSILSKAHQINSAALSANDFIVWVYLFFLVLSSVVYAVYSLISNRKRRGAAANGTEIIVSGDKSESTVTDGKVKKEPIFGAGKNAAVKAVAVIALMAVISGVGYLLQLISAVNLDASVLYPMVTGGTIILTTLSGSIFFKEKISLWMLLSLIFTLVGTILFLF
jgi:drug/metabolite transporter (DMT)-like permease